jgi:hypothetical protein
MTAVRHFPCILCEKRTKPQERRFLSGDNNKPLRKYLFKTFFVSVHDGDVLCGKCRRVYYTDCNQKLECTSYISSIYLELPPIKQYICMFIFQRYTSKSHNFMELLHMISVLLFFTINADIRTPGWCNI